jgi:hypothetical protein
VNTVERLHVSFAFAKFFEIKDNPFGKMTNFGFYEACPRDKISLQRKFFSSDWMTVANACNRVWNELLVIFYKGCKCNIVFLTSVLFTTHGLFMYTCIHVSNTFHTQSCTWGAYGYSFIAYD